MKHYYLLGVFLLSWLLGFSQNVYRGEEDINDGVESVVFRIEGKTKEGIGEVFGNPSGLDEVYLQWVKEVGYVKQGTGFVVLYGDKYYFITNAHVIEHNLEEVIAYDTQGNKFAVTYLGADTFYDIAIYEVETERKISALKLGTKDLLKEHIKVSSFGYSEGKRNLEERKGTIEKPNEKIKTHGIRLQGSYIKHTPSLPRGYSGGPLVDANTGLVLGMNTRVEGGYTYAIRCDLLKRLLEEIIKDGHIGRVWLGIEFIEAKEGCGSGLPRINHIFPNSPAFEKLANSPVFEKSAGYKDWEIEMINNKPTYSLKHLLTILEKIKPNTRVTLKLKKDNQQYETTLRSGKIKTKQYKAIAQYYFKTYQGIGLEEKDHVFIHRDADNLHCGNSSLLLAAGVELSPSYRQLFYIRDLRTLGIVIRLTSWCDNELQISLTNDTSEQKRKCQKLISHERPLLFY